MSAALACPDDLARRRESLLDEAYATVMRVAVPAGLSRLERAAYVRAINDALEALARIGARHPAIVQMEERR